MPVCMHAHAKQHVHAGMCDGGEALSAARASCCLPALACTHTQAPAPIASALLAASIYNASQPIASTVQWDTAICPGTPRGQAGCGPAEQQCVQASASTRASTGHACIWARHALLQPV